MYWPIGTPRIFATESAHVLPPPQTSHDGIDTGSDTEPEIDRFSRSSTHEIPNTPKTPATPATPDIRSVDDEWLRPQTSCTTTSSPVPSCVPSHKPILSLRVARTGHLFATITATSINIWQTKPTVILAIIIRSSASVESYGSNVDILLRPDSAILVVQTVKGYLITYSVATDTETNVYRAHFRSHHNIQRRRQTHSIYSSISPDHTMWGPGEGARVKDISVKFRMVIKLDAGIQSAIALDDELIVATKKPAAVQCIRWSPDQHGNQMNTEILSRTSWLDRKTTVTEITHDRPMSLSTWITSNGKAYAIQKNPQPIKVGSVSSSGDPSKNEHSGLFKGYCFHTPRSSGQQGTRCAINARFSLLAVGCSDATVRVYVAKDYLGNIPFSHSHLLPVSLAVSGHLTSLIYSPDGYCLFAGYEMGWATWSVYGQLQAHSFGNWPPAHERTRESWLSGVSAAYWVGGACELLLAGRGLETVWLLEMARNAITGCYNRTNIFRTILQTASGIMIYRGYDLPDLTSISAEPFLWHNAEVPPIYLMDQWPIRYSAISSEGRYVAVAGRRGLAHYSVNSGRWKTFTDKTAENEFQVRGGMCWYHHKLVAAVETDRSFELRLYSRESSLDYNGIFHIQPLPAPVVLMTTTGEESLLVYTYENLLYHFIFATNASRICMVQVGQIALHGIVRSPARVRGLSWILPERQILHGDPSQDVTVASVLFLVDGKLILLQPSRNHEGNMKYDMKLMAQSVEFYVCMSDQPFAKISENTGFAADLKGRSLANSLWMLDEGQLKVWPDFSQVISAASSDIYVELPPLIRIPIDFYPLSLLLDKALVLGVETELIRRRDIDFSFFRFAIRTHLCLPEILRFHLAQGDPNDALVLAQSYQTLEYFSHALEILLHHVLDDEADTEPKPEEAVLPRVLSLLSSFQDYLDIVVQCTRKTEARSWRTLFAYLPPPQELFEESLLKGMLKTAGGYLLILHTFEKLDTASDQSVRLLSRAMQEENWDLCRELARFLAALDHTGETLRSAISLASIKITDRKTIELMNRLHISSKRHRPRTVSGNSMHGKTDDKSSDLSNFRYAIKARDSP